MSNTNIVLAQGAGALGFEVFDHGSRGGDPFNKCGSTAERGDLVYFTGENEVSQASGALAETARLAGFIENTVVASIPGNQRIDWHDEFVLVDADPVTIWRKGRVRLIKVDGSFSAGDAVWPDDDGGVSDTQTGSAPQVGVCVEGNANADEPIVVEFDLTH